jgi:DNA-directed RNA polymerase specialized sigma24 family protein
MHKELGLTKESFDRLLAWLDPDRDRAGEKYEQIRHRLIKIFTCRGCPEAEVLADETINRVNMKVSEVAAEYVGDPALYFYGVAQKVFLESLRQRHTPVVPPPPQPASEEEEQAYECLERCMEQLPQSARELVLEYYQNDKRAKIDHRKELARRLGIAQNALRIRAHRIRVTLQQCVRACVEQGTAA